MMQDEDVRNIFLDKIPMPEVWNTTKWSLNTSYGELSFYSDKNTDEAEYTLEVNGRPVSRDGHTLFNVYDGCGGVFQVIVKDSNEQ